MGKRAASSDECFLQPFGFITSAKPRVLIYWRSLVLTASVAVVLEGDALFLDVVDELYAAVAHRCISGDELVDGGCSLVHLDRYASRAGADALVA